MAEDKGTSPLGGLQARMAALGQRRQQTSPPRPLGPALSPATARPRSVFSGRPSSPPPPLVPLEPIAVTNPEDFSAAVRTRMNKELPRELIENGTRGVIMDEIDRIIAATAQELDYHIDGLDRRDLARILLTDLVTASQSVLPSKAEGNKVHRASIDEAKRRVQPKVLEKIDSAIAAQLSREELSRQLGSVVSEILVEERVQLNQLEQRELVAFLLDDMLGLGPLEPLLADDTVTDILVNGPRQTYVERRGKLELSDVVFRDNAHVMAIATRIVSRVGRRIDESHPLVDARLMDGSRVNIIGPPLSLDGTSISIRKFSKKGITLDIMARQGNISPAMAVVLKIAARSGLNILISGGTGSGKTTLLNALSQMIDPGERIVTIEDAAELQLQQPHVVRLETRIANLEGEGEINMRDLVKNALRMRPDRIIVGEIRGSEAFDMLQAMNTGHDGSLGTIHANRPREALTRLENMIGMAVNLPSKATRTQIAGALDMIVQISRMRDGVRRVTAITEVLGMEGDVITTQDLFLYEFEGEDKDGKLRGQFRSMGLRPHFTPTAAYFGLDKTLLEAI